MEPSYYLNEPDLGSITVALFLDYYQMPPARDHLQGQTSSVRQRRFREPSGTARRQVASGQLLLAAKMSTKLQGQLGGQQHAYDRHALFMGKSCARKWPCWSFASLSARGRLSTTPLTFSTVMIGCNNAETHPHSDNGFANRAASSFQIYEYIYLSFPIDTKTRSVFLPRLQEFRRSSLKLR